MLRNGARDGQGNVWTAWYCVSGKPAVLRPTASSDRSEKTRNRCINMVMRTNDETGDGARRDETADARLRRAVLKRADGTAKSISVRYSTAPRTAATLES